MHDSEMTEVENKKDKVKRIVNPLLGKDLFVYALEVTYKFTTKEFTDIKHRLIKSKHSKKRINEISNDYNIKLNIIQIPFRIQDPKSRHYTKCLDP